MTRPLLFLFLALACRAIEPTAFTIKTMTAQMKYDTAELLVQPGQQVQLTFENGDDLPTTSSSANPAPTPPPWR
jgi:hypothetical protein